VGRITLICTAHRASGKCNEHELVKILLAVGPEVIFEEIRPADLESSYADESKHTLEMRAIREYLKDRKAQQVPVDDYEMPEGFEPYMRALGDFVESRNGEYRDAMEERFRKQFELGFSYLNSSAFVSSIKESERLYQETVSKYGNDLARSKLSTWNDLIRKRDASMLGNIYKFCQRTDFMEGVFLVGAGHMSSIKDEIERRMNDQPTLVTWRFWNGP
jgi:pheromone shutdown protein TraB